MSPAPGHGAPSVLAHAWLEGVYGDVYPDKGQSEEGMRRFCLAKIIGRCEVAAWDDRRRKRISGCGAEPAFPAPPAKVRNPPED